MSSVGSVSSASTASGDVNEPRDVPELVAQGSNQVMDLLNMAMDEIASAAGDLSVDGGTVDGAAAAATVGGAGAAESVGGVTLDDIVAAYEVCTRYDCIRDKAELEKALAELKHYKTLNLRMFAVVEDLSKTVRKLNKRVKYLVEKLAAANNEEVRDDLKSVGSGGGAKDDANKDLDEDDKELDGSPIGMFISGGPADRPKRKTSTEPGKSSVAKEKSSTMPPPPNRQVVPEAQGEVDPEALREAGLRRSARSKKQPPGATGSASVSSMSAKSTGSRRMSRKNKADTQAMVHNQPHLIMRYKTINGVRYALQDKVKIIAVENSKTTTKKKANADVPYQQLCYLNKEGVIVKFEGTITEILVLGFVGKRSIFEAKPGWFEKVEVETSGAGDTNADEA